MDAITDFLFASPMTLGAVCVVVCLVLLVRWRRTGSGGRRKVFLAAVVASAVLFVSQEIVVTDRERLVAIVRGLAEAVEKPDFDRIEQVIDSTYNDGAFTRDTLLPAIRGALTSRSVVHPSVSAFEVETGADEATVRFRAVADIRMADNMVTNLPSRWEVRFIRRDGEWQVRSITPLKVATQDVRGGLRGLMSW